MIKIILKQVRRSGTSIHCGMPGDCGCHDQDYEAETEGLAEKWQPFEYGRTPGEALCKLVLNNAQKLGLDPEAMKKAADSAERGLKDPDSISEALIDELGPLLEKQGIALVQD